jgi:hypothetical protein
MDYLRKRADELDLRVAVPNRFDEALKPYAQMTDADWEYVEAEHREDQEHNAERLRGLEDLASRMAEHGASEEDKVDDVFEERDGKLMPKRQDADDGEGKGEAGDEDG